MTLRRSVALLAFAALLAGPAAAQQSASPSDDTPIRAEKPDPQKQFLIENAKRPGWKTTPSGLQYKAVKPVTNPAAPSPLATDAVLVNYEGRLIDGTVFDSSYERGEPISFPLNRVIAGWTEGVQLMKVGETYEFAIPGRLAYGARGVPQAGIGPNATLLFKVELLEILPPGAMPPR
ncbi:FKBP-type peptidyl-prolyl cis-trans isomerase [Rhodospirillum centenum]|uniref:Peptidyl-prolyl cis-trans isomerase n=1 Tax=Rhodospirillum centenum (strain ATCC 51521 / SW) TaxID=414684 RepID=B6ISF1_RHOCS|nr:FKBP-type peptidyl-prolyl cis-trans isomerase [Rhodospirillum centenum]ACI98387.1 fkbp-type peptidyl-prolyl cis-trans isomerase FkpA [Rhodospirillum centenum SW]